MRMPDGTLFIDEPDFDAISGVVSLNWYWSGPGGSGKACQMALLHTDADCHPAGGCISAFRRSVQRVVENTLQGRGSGGWREAGNSWCTRRLAIANGVVRWRYANLRGF